ncbi:MAG: MCE family protein, partial [Jatrophihabitans sp.]
YVVVRSSNLLGHRFLSPTRDGAPSTPLPPPPTIAQSHTAPALSLTALFNGFRPLFRALNAEQINKFSTEIIQILQGESGTIEDLLSQTAQLTSNLSDRDQLFVSVVDNLGALLRSVSRHDTQLGQLVDSLAGLTRNLAADSPNIGRSIDAIDGLAGSVDGLLTGLNGHDFRGRVIDLEKLTSVVAANQGVLDKTIKAFPVAFSDFNRVTQNGNWINAYPCTIKFGIPLSPVITPDQIAQAIAAFIGNDSLSIVLGLLGGLLPPGSGLPVPLNIPQGAVNSNPATHSAVCR